MGSLDLEMSERGNHSVKPRKKGGASYWKPFISSCSVMMMMMCVELYAEEQHLPRRGITYFRLVSYQNPPTHPWR